MPPPSKKPKRSTAKTSKAPRPSSGSRASKRSGARGSAPPLFEEWIEFLRALISTNARFLVVGGHAVAVHGEPRLTEDLDVLIEPTLENGERVRAALERFGFGALAPPAADFTEPRRVFMLGRKPRRIDVLTSIDGLDFAVAWAGHLDVELGGTVVPLLGRQALLVNKRASGRPKDLADVDAIERSSSREAPRIHHRRR